MQKWRFAIIVLMIISNVLSSQADVNLEKVEGEGLTNYYIKCIQQDRNGFLWFGTEEGLFRYDGYDFKPFKNFPGDSQTLVNNNIEFLFPEKNFLWVGSRGGLTRIDINTDKVENFSPAEILTVYSVLAENDSVFWVGTSEGLFQFNKRSHAWKRIEAVDRSVFIRSLCDDGKHHLYITSHNGFYCYDKTTRTCKHYLIPNEYEQPSSRILHRSVLDDSGNVWMTSWDAGLIEFDPHTEKIKEWLYNKNQSALYPPYVRAFDILKNTDGNLWLANGENGLTIFNPSNHTMMNSPITWNVDDKSINRTYALFKDRTGIYWIGTENGIFKYDPHTVHLSKINFQLPADIAEFKSHLAPLCMLKDREGLWWLGTYEGLFLIDTATGLLHDYTAQAGIPKSTLITSIIQDSRGIIWVASGNTLIALNKKGSVKNISFQSEIYRSPDIRTAIMSLCLNDEDGLWIGTHGNGVFMFNCATKKFISFPYGDSNIGSNQNEVRCFYEISPDSLLVGGEHSGLLLLHTNNGRYEKINWNDSIATPADNLTINSIIKDDHAFWIATDLNGLWQCDHYFQKVNRLTTQNGLPSMNIASVIADARNHLWLLTEGGVVDFQPRGNSVKVYDKKDGLQNLSALGAIIHDKGNIVIGDRGCLQFIRPYDVVKNSKPPEVFITGFKVFDKEYPVSDNKVIRLKYDQNYFSVEYVALNYTQTGLNQYAYRLEGLDQQWNNVGTRRYVSYAGLKEGTYSFKVIACNNEGVWNDVPAAITLIIDPPFWHTWWFYSLIALCILGIFYFIYLMKLNQWKMKYQLRNKIARDLHDDIGSTLSGINIFSKIALQKIQTDQSASGELLRKISDRSEKTMDALDDIVWSINTKNDGMDNVLEKMQEYLSETLEPQNIAYSFVIDPSIHQTKLDMEVRKELYLIFKEAINNACKYAQCKHVNIFLRRKRDHCTLTIHDDGKGFDMSTINPGNGIYNMQTRAARMNASFSISSERNKGTSVSLEFRIT